MHIKVIPINNMINFLKEFDFSGISSARFFNTLFLVKNKKDYIINYFKLIGNPNVNAMIPKLNSKEFNKLIKDFEDTPGIPPINNRLILYYGNQGTGKTTKAIKDNPNAKVMNCNSNFEPNDLLESFDFDDGLEQVKKYGYNLDDVEFDHDAKMKLVSLIIQAGGKPKYKPTPLLEAMINGEKVILDEINLLNRDCLRSLQAFLDNKTEFVYKDRTITIKDDFMVIGTMNLEVNGQIECLPAPLVDRAKEIIEFVPNAEFLAKVAFGE